MIATHPMDFAGKMNMDQMLEAAKLGAILEFDFRNILDEGGRADAIRKDGRPSKRCRMHGGLSCGPKTEAGRAAVAPVFDAFITSQLGALPTGITVDAAAARAAAERCRPTSGGNPPV